MYLLSLVSYYYYLPLVIVDITFPAGNHLTDASSLWYNSNMNIKSKGAYYRERNQSMLERCYLVLGDRCIICGYQGTALQIDHVNGNINKERTYRVRANVLKGNAIDYQLLCANCNWEKRTYAKENGGNMTKFLSITLLLNTYKRLLNEKGYASCGLVAEELGRLGVITRTGKAPTRQAVHFRIVQTQEGRDMLSVTKRRIGRAD